MKNYFKTKRRREYFLQPLARKNIWVPCEILLQRNTMAGHKRITFQVCWHYRHTQEIRRNVWKLRMKRWMIKAHQRKCPLQRRYFKSKIRSQARYVQKLKKNLDFREGGSLHCCLSVSARFRYDFCCIPCSNKVVLIWSENVTHIYMPVWRRQS